MYHVLNISKQRIEREPGTRLDQAYSCEMIRSLSLHHCNQNLANTPYRNCILPPLGIEYKTIVSVLKLFSFWIQILTVE
jgi:hypothetical protein